VVVVMVGMVVVMVGFVVVRVDLGVGYFYVE